MSTTKSDFGTIPGGAGVDQYTLTNKNGAVAKVITYGARLTELHMPDKAGKLADVVLGFDNLTQYLQPEPYLGCTVGRVANRIGGAQFTLGGVTYRLSANEGSNTLHGGAKALDKVLWSAAAVSTPGGAAVRFTYTSPDMDQGFPGKLECAVTYTLTDANALNIEYVATTDKPTPVNFTNHSYFNLAGAGNGTILDQVLKIEAGHYTPVDAALIPTGEILPVQGTSLDFTNPTPIGQRIAQAGGYDHNYVLNSGGGRLALAATVRDPRSGRVMEVLTTQPGVQLYTANFLDGSLRGIGGVFPKHGALCLETQHFPDSVNRPLFPSCIVDPGQTYRQQTVYRFSAT